MLKASSGQLKPICQSAEHWANTLLGSSPHVCTSTEMQLCYEQQILSPQMILWSISHKSGQEDSHCRADSAKPLQRSL